MRGCAAVAARPHELHAPAAGGGQHGAGERAELTYGHLGGGVHAEDALAVEALEQPVVQHLLCAAATLLRRLEYEVHRTCEVRVAVEQPCRAQKHRGVSVVAAGVHLAGNLGGVLEAVGLLQRQAVHIAAQADGALAGAGAADGGYEAGAAQRGHFGHSPAGEFLGHQGGRAHLFVT